MNQKTYLKEFARYTSLNVLGMIGLSCYILADTFFVSRGLGAAGLTALNLAIPIYSFIHGSGLMLGVGGATKYSVFKGQRNDRKANEVFSNTIYAALALAAVFMLCGVFLSEKITFLMGADQEVFAMTNTYLRVILLFAPAFVMNDVLICFVRNDGNPKLSMSAMLIGSFSNIILDYVFIFPLRMGIFGAVLATGIAPVVSMLILSGHMRREEHFGLVKKKLNPQLLRTIVSLGVPSLITEAAGGIVIIVFNKIILNIQGNVGVAAYGVVANLSLVILSIYTGIAQGMQPPVSKAHGTGDKNGTKQLLRYAMRTMLAVSFVIYLCIFLFADPIAGVFNSENNVRLQEMAVVGLKLYFLAVPFAGFNIVISMFFTATEKALPAQTVSLLRGLILIIPLALLLSYFAGLTGVWLAFPVTEGIVSAAGAVLYQRFRS